jgi:hypothetical protein
MYRICNPSTRFPFFAHEICQSLSVLKLVWTLDPTVIRKVTLSFTPYDLFQWYLQSKEILIKSQYEIWNSAFNAQGSSEIWNSVFNAQGSSEIWNSVFNVQGSKLTIVVVQVGAVKIYVAAVEALKKRGKTWWNSVYHPNWWKN